MTVFSISLTGQKYYRIDMRIKSQTKKPVPEGLGGLLALMDEDDEQDEEEKKQELESQQEQKAKADEERKLIQEATTDFMTKLFEYLIKKTF